MAEPTDVTGDVIAALAAVADLPTDLLHDPERHGDTLADARKKRDSSRRVQALALKMAGLSNDEIGERLNLSESGVRDMLNRSLTRAENKQVEEMRAVEGMRLDRAQIAIWSEVLRGDMRAIDTFLRISSRRAKLFGLDAPTQVNLSVSVRQEMEHALLALEQVVLEGEVVESHTDGAEVSGDASNGAGGPASVESG